MSTLSPPGPKVSTSMILDPFLPSTEARATSTTRNWSRNAPPSPQRFGDGGVSQRLFLPTSVPGVPVFRDGDGGRG